MSKSSNDNDRIVVNVTNNISTSNTNTNNNENSNDNENINKNTNVNLGLYKTLTWLLGLILLIIFIRFCAEKIQIWVNTPPEKTYRNFNGNYNLIRQFHDPFEVEINIGDWAITDIISVDKEIFGIYRSKVTAGLPDTLIIGDASDIYTFLDDSYYRPRRIMVIGNKYILLAQQSTYKTIIQYRNKFRNNYEGEYAKITQQGGQYLGLYYDEKNGYAFMYSMNNCSDSKLVNNFPIATLVEEMKSKKGFGSYCADCFDEPAHCDIVKSSCSLEISYDFNEWVISKTKITVDDFFEFVKDIDNESCAILTIIKDDNSILARELSNK